MSKQLPVYFLIAALAAAATLPSAHAAGSSASASYGMPAATPPKAIPVKPESYGAAVAHKLGVGVSNLLFGMGEVPKNMVNTINEGGIALGLSLGTVKGAIHGAGRLLIGATDLVTFMVPTQPITTPEYVWETPDHETRYNPLFQLKP